MKWKEDNRKNEQVYYKGIKQNIDIKLMEKERLLTEQERKYIINAIENRDWRLGIILLGISFLVLLVLWVLFIKEGYIKGVVMSLIWWGVLVVLTVGDAIISTNKLLKLAKKNEIYVREAVFLDLSKYSYGIFEIAKNGKRKIWGCKAGRKDDIKVGDKVILVKIKKRLVWIYKARKDDSE